MSDGDFLLMNKSNTEPDVVWLNWCSDSAVQAHSLPLSCCVMAPDVGDIDMSIGFELDLGRKPGAAQHEPQLDADEADEVDVDEDDESAQSVPLLAFGFTISTLLTALHTLVTVELSSCLMSGESSMNANVFLRSSNVNEQLESLGVCGALPIDWLIELTMAP